MCINAVNLNKLAKTNCVTEIAKVVTKPILQTLATDTVSFSANALAKGFTKLSQEVSHRFPDKGYRIASLPIGMEIAQDGFRVTKKIPTIAIVDMFGNTESVKMGSGIKIPHGILTTKYAVRDLEDKVGVLAFDLEYLRKNDAYKGINKALETLLEIQKEFKNIDALNLSVSDVMYYETLSDKTGLFLSAENIEKNKKELLRILSKSKDKRLKQAYDSIQLINKLVDSGVKVFSASGNMSDETIDLLSLSKARIVTASDFKGANTVFATDAAEGKHLFKTIYDDFGNLTSISDGKITLTTDDFCSKTKKRNFLSSLFSSGQHEIKGTSYSCPIKLNQILQKDFANKT